MAEAFLGENADKLLKKTIRQFSYICCFNRNIEKLKTQLEELQPITQGVQQWVDAEHVRVIAPQIQAWLKSVHDVESEVGEIIKEKPEVKKGWCPNPKLRYSLSRKAMKKTKVIVDLRKVGVSFTVPSCGPPPTCTETIPSEDNRVFESRSLNMEEIINALKDDEINLIGICGLPGVGKTKMAKEIVKRAKEDGLFVEVAWAVVSQTPNITNIQACIADMLGLKQLDGWLSPIDRADHLRERLLQDNKKILVILDDVWAEFDLEDVGIPLGGANKNFKMLYTSRNRGLWHDLKAKIEIPLELLSKYEAWKLFREQVGDCVDAPDLQPIAKEIVNACGCLPLALVLIGKALSKKSSGNFTKSIWEDMRNRLTCSSSTPADMRLSSSLELSYQAIEDEEAKRLFLLCCLFEENKSIPIEDLVRYALAFSLFDDGIMGMRKIRAQVFNLVAYLQSRYLLLEDPYKSEQVKVHDLVRDMGISIASKYKGALGSHGTISEYPKKNAYEYALVSHGAAFEWPNKDKFQHYTSILVTSEEITELPEDLTCPNLEFLLLRCKKLEKLPCHFFKEMGKLKVLELYEYAGIIPTLQPLTNLTMLFLEGLYRGVWDYVPVIEPVIGDLFNLEILSFRNLNIEELPKEIGKLVKLRLLDLTGTHRLRRIPPGVVSCLVRLEELYILYSNFEYWEGEGEEKGRNAKLIEFKSLSHLNTLEIRLRKDVLIPKVPIFRKLEKYKLIMCREFYRRDNQYERQLMVNAQGRDITADHGGFDSLLRRSDHTFLRGVGCNDLVRELLLRDGVDGLQQLKCLQIEDCNTPECLANTMNWVQQQPNDAATAIFPILEKLHLQNIVDLREICHGPIPAGSFGKLTEIDVCGCHNLRCLFPLPVVECLTQLRSLQIWSCDMMEEVIWNEQREDVHIATNNRIEFPKLETLGLDNLSSLVGFCRGIDIDQINFPRLKDMYLWNLLKLEHVVHNSSNLSSNSEQYNNVNSLSLFPQKVTFPSSESLALQRFKNVSNELPAFSLSKLKELKVSACESSRNMFYPSMAAVLVNLQTLIIEDCLKMETIVDWEKEQEREIPKTLFPQLKKLELKHLPHLTMFCYFTHPIELPLLRKVKILDCRRMNAFSFGHVSTPNLYLQGVSGNCKAKFLDFSIPDKQDLSTPDPKSRGEKYSRRLQLQVHQYSDAIVSMSDRGSTSGGTPPEQDVLKELNYYPMEGCLTQFSEEELLEQISSEELEEISSEELEEAPSNPRELEDLIGVPIEFPPTSSHDDFSNLQELDLSYIEINSLPQSISRLVSLQKLFLRSCMLLIMELPPEIGELPNLEVLDLEGTEILCLPKEIAKLVNLTCLKVSFYGYAKQIVIPRKVLSNLSHLNELIIDVTSYGQWWDVEVEAIIDDLCSLKELRTLQLYLPTVELLKELTLIFPGLANFRFTVGRQKEHFISRLPQNVEEEFNNREKLEKGLKYVNGGCIPNEITMLFKHVNAFFLQRHWTAESLSEFGHENLKEVKFCLVMECNEFRTIIDYEKLCQGKDGRAEYEDFMHSDEATVLGSLERLIIHYMKNMESIWKGPVVKGSLSNLKSLALHTCPNLTTLFTIDMLSNLGNLEQLMVEDCPKINSLVSLKSSGSKSDIFLPRLKKISLLQLPGLVSISSGQEIAPKLERIVIFYCPKLEKLSAKEVSSPKLKVIKGENEWWDALKWYESDVSTEHKDYLAGLFIPLRRDGDLMAQLTGDEIATYGQGEVGSFKIPDRPSLFSEEELSEEISSEELEETSSEELEEISSEELEVTSSKELEATSSKELEETSSEELDQTPSNPREWFPTEFPPILYHDDFSIFRVLDLSRTEIKSLPQSMSRLVSLQKLFLRSCTLLMMELPPEIGELTNLEVLDLEGTEILCLPKEIAKLVNLKCLKVSFYGYANQTAIPRRVLSNLSCLNELIIDVTPYGEWWDVEVEAIMEDLCSLKELRTLKLYLPKAELLEELTLIFPGLANFRFTVGHCEEHIISRLPRDVEEEFNNWEKLEKGLKYVDGDRIPSEIPKVFKHVDAFYLQSHWTAKSLSEFGCENLKEVKFCLVMECNEFRTIIDSEKLYQGKDGRAESEDFPVFDEAMVLGSLERLIVRYMKNMESIWKGPVGKGSLSNLKSLALHTCPNLTTLFTIAMLSNLENLEELIVEDCPKINSLVSLKSSGSKSDIFLPNLKKISLLQLPGLVSISSGQEIAPKLERMVIFYCPKLEKLSAKEVSSTQLKVIKGENEWWDALKWYESDVSTVHEDYLAGLFIPLRRDGDLMAQLTEV